MSNKIDCRAAFADLLDVLESKTEKEIQHKINDPNDPIPSPDYPSRCIVVFNQDGEYQVTWNDVSNGKRHASAYQICKKGIR